MQSRYKGFRVITSSRLDTVAHLYCSNAIFNSQHLMDSEAPRARSRRHSGAGRLLCTADNENSIHGYADGGGRLENTMCLAFSLWLENSLKS